MHLSSSVGDYIGYFDPVQVEVVQLGQHRVIVFTAVIITSVTVKSVTVILQGSFPLTGGA